MNRVYTYTFALIIFIWVNNPGITQAQCNCSVGHPATPIDYSVSMPLTNASSSSVTFPKFNPAIGSLYCMSVKDTVSCVTTTNCQNTAPDTTIYNWLLSMSGNLTGPGVNVSQSTTKTYGPDTLAGLGTPGDATVHGPDTIFNNATAAQNVSSPSASYIGAGNFSFTFQMSGGAIPTMGGSNYTAGPTTNYWGVFHLTYYWCPAAPLSTTIQDLSASPDGSTILLTWTTTDQQPNTLYEIQVSTDGKNFYNAGQAQGDASSAGSTAKYQYQYNPDPSYVGKLYFRIEETDGYGKVNYSAILIVDPKGNSANDGEISFHTWPNPAHSNVVFQFGSNQTGRFLIELISTAGQVVQQKAVTLTGTSQIRLDLNAQPVKGLYFLRTTDLSHSRKYTSKVFIE